MWHQKTHLDHLLHLDEIGQISLCNFTSRKNHCNKKNFLFRTSTTQHEMWIVASQKRKFKNKRLWKYILPILNQQHATSNNQSLLHIKVKRWKILNRRRNHLLQEHKTLYSAISSEIIYWNQVLLVRGRPFWSTSVGRRQAELYTEEANHQSYPWNRSSRKDMERSMDVFSLGNGYRWHRQQVFHGGMELMAVQQVHRSQENFHQALGSCDK